MGIISPSRFSVLATEGFEEGDTTEVKEDDETEDEIEEGEVVTEVQKVRAKTKDIKAVRFRAGTSFKLSTQGPARSKDVKVVRSNNNSKKASSRKL